MKAGKVVVLVTVVTLLIGTAACSSSPAVPEAAEVTLDLVPVRVFPRVGGTTDYYVQPEYGSTVLPDGTSAYYITNGKSPWWWDRFDDDAVCLWFEGFEGFNGSLSDYHRITVDVAFETEKMTEIFYQFGSYLFIDENSVFEEAINPGHLFWFDVSALPRSPMEFTTVEGITGHAFDPFETDTIFDRILFFFVSEAKDRDINGAIYLRNLRLYK